MENNPKLTLPREISEVLHAVFPLQKGGDNMGYLSSDTINMIAYTAVGIFALKQFFRLLTLILK